MSALLAWFGQLAGTIIRYVDKREERIYRTVEAFGRITRNDGERDGVKAFLRAGAKELRRREVRPAVDRILGRYGSKPHPLGPDGEQLKGRRDLWAYVQGLDPDEDHDPPDYTMLYVG